LTELPLWVFSGYYNPLIQDAPQSSNYAYSYPELPVSYSLVYWIINRNHTAVIYSKLKRSASTASDSTAIFQESGEILDSAIVWIAILPIIAVATAVRTRAFLWGRFAPPQKRPKKSGYSYMIREGGVWKKIMKSYRPVLTLIQKIFMSSFTLAALSFSQMLPVLAQDAILRANDPNARINLRQSPDPNSQQLGYGLVGDRVQILNQTSGTDGYTWYRVQFPNSGALGWIRGDFVRVEGGTSGNPSAEAYLRAADPNSRINLRDAPSSSARQVGYGLVGDRVFILEQTPGSDGYFWYRVRFPNSGATGWIRGDFISL